MKSRIEQNRRNLRAHRPARVKMQNLKCQIIRTWIPGLGVNGKARKGYI